MSQAALRQQMAMQQRQEAMRLLSTLAPEQREQLSRLQPLQQASCATSSLRRFPISTDWSFETMAYALYLVHSIDFGC